MTRTGHFILIVLFITGFFLAAHVIKRMQVVGSVGPTYEGFEMSNGAIAGTVIGVLALVGILGYFIYKRRGTASVAAINYSGYNRGINNGRGYNNRGAAAY